MIYAVKHNKGNRSLYRGNEDSLTSAIFERLLYLPNEMFQHLMEKALYDSIPNLDLRRFENITYWPHWDPTGTGNKLRVEPDVFIRTATADIIIEAKREDERQQDPSQWRAEITSYYNEFKEEPKDLIFIALGGLHSTDTEKIWTAKGKYTKIYKCTWSRILGAAKDAKYRMETSLNSNSQSAANQRIIDDLILCFALFGFSTAEWFEHFLPPQNIDETRLNLLTTTWKN